jgi:hypothetical protein
VKELGRAVAIALLIGIGVAIGAYLTAPGRPAPTPIIVPLKGDLPPSLVHPVEPDTNPICGAAVCDTR